MVYAVKVGLTILARDENGDFNWSKPSRTFIVGTTSRIEAERICEECEIDTDEIIRIHMLEEPIGYDALEAR